MSHPNYSLSLVTILSLNLLCTPSLALARHHDDDSYHKKESKAGLIGALIGGAAVVAGACALGSWMAEPTNEQLVSDAQRTTDALEARYSHIVDLVNSHEVQEKQLAMIADYIMAQESCTRTYSAHMEHAVKTLDSLYKRLHTRHDKAVAYAHHHYWENEKEVRILQDAKNYVGRVWEPLRNALLCLQGHKSYFALYTLERTLHSRYGHILDAVQWYETNPPKLAHRAELMHQIRSAVMNHGAQVRSKYPYIGYVEKLTKDKQDLDNALRKQREYYPDIEHACKMLSKDLELIKHEILADSGYAQDLRNQEHDRLERERLALQQRQAALLAENQRLMYELAAGNQRPKIVVRHVYKQPVVRRRIIIKKDIYE